MKTKRERTLLLLTITILAVMAAVYFSDTTEESATVSSTGAAPGAAPTQTAMTLGQYRETLADSLKILRRAAAIDTQYAQLSIESDTASNTEDQMTAGDAFRLDVNKIFKAYNIEAGLSTPKYDEIKDVDEYEFVVLKFTGIEISWGRLLALLPVLEQSGIIVEECTVKKPSPEASDQRLSLDITIARLATKVDDQARQ